VAAVAITLLAQSPLLTTAGSPEADHEEEIFFCIALPQPSAERLMAVKVPSLIRPTTSSPLLLIQL
jgi:hypothetical protein